MGEQALGLKSGRTSFSGGNSESPITEHMLDRIEALYYGEFNEKDSTLNINSKAC